MEENNETREERVMNRLQLYQISLFDNQEFKRGENRTRIEVHIRWKDNW